MRAIVDEDSLPGLGLEKRMPIAVGPRRALGEGRVKNTSTRQRIKSKQCEKAETKKSTHVI